jgi:hypothetical protein
MVQGSRFLSFAPVISHTSLDLCLFQVRVLLHTIRWPIDKPFEKKGMIEGIHITASSSLFFFSWALIGPWKKAFKTENMRI